MKNYTILTTILILNGTTVATTRTLHAGAIVKGTLAQIQSGEKVMERKRSLMADRAAELNLEAGSVREVITGAQVVRLSSEGLEDITPKPTADGTGAVVARIPAELLPPLGFAITEVHKATGKNVTATVTVEGEVYQTLDSFVHYGS